MTTATLNVYNPIHLSQAVVVAGREVVRRSRVDKAAKLFTFVRFHPISTRRVQATSMFRELRTRPRMLGVTARGALTRIENLRAGGDRSDATRVGGARATLKTKGRAFGSFHASARFRAHKTPCRGRSRQAFCLMIDMRQK